MDCCNYMQYRHHQPYYGSQYYNPLPPYHGDFYGQQMYPEYYGNSPYYSQQWPCAASFPDYVYSPKEARIRKAMRDATRDRSIGVPPMLPRPNARRVPHNWVSPHDELMMSPLVGMRATMESSAVCNFSLPSSATNQFISPPMNGYSKLETTMPSVSASVHTNYMQPNPLTQLQQHTEMWPDYQPMRPRPSGDPFMIPEVSTYQQQIPQQISNNMMVNKSNINTTVSRNSPHTNENIPPDEINDKNPNIISDYEDKSVVKNVQTLIENNNSGNFVNVFEPNDINRRSFETVDDVKMKKPIIASQIRNNTKKSSNKPLPDFNEAFGSTERGRFQSPPDPRLAPNKSYLDYFFDNSSVKFDDY